MRWKRQDKIEGVRGCKGKGYTKKWIQEGREGEKRGLIMLGITRLEAEITI